MTALTFAHEDNSVNGEKLEVMCDGRRERWYLVKRMRLCFYDGKAVTLLVRCISTCQVEMSSVNKVTGY